MSPKPSASIRANVRHTPPGLVGEMIRTGFVGQSAANAICASPTPTAATTIVRMRRFMLRPIRVTELCSQFILRAFRCTRIRLLSLLARHKLPNPTRCQRKMARLRPERRQCMRHGIRKRATGRDNPTLAGALRAQRIVRARIVFGEDATQAWKVGRGRQQIVGERAGEELTLLVILKMFEARAAEALHHGTDHLALERE